MSLVLKLRPGDDFYVAKERVVVGELLGGPRFVLKVDSTGRRYEITDEESVEMREVRDVFLASGGRAQAGLARVAIDAPREISILRGAVMRGELGGGDGRMPPLRRGPGPEGQPRKAMDMTFKAFTATAEAIRQARLLGLYGDTAKRLSRAARRSAPFTSELGNRRFLDFALTVEGDRVVWVNRIVYCN